MSSGDWKTISSRCKTGFFQEIASNTQVSCDNSQALQPPAIGIPNFCIMLYTGAVARTTFGTLESTGVKNAFCNSTITDICEFQCTVPCQASGSNPSAWQDWYVLDELLVEATTQLHVETSEYPQTVNTTGAVAMGIGFDGDNDPPTAVMKSMEGPYGSIDISFGIVPSHTHSNTSNTPFYLPTPESLNDILNTNIEHYHPLPAIYLSTFSTPTSNDTDANTGLRFEAAAKGAPAVDDNPQFYAANRQVYSEVTSTNENVKPNNIFWGGGGSGTDKGYGGGAHVYAMSSPEDLYKTGSNGGGYSWDGSGNNPKPWPSAYSTEGVPEGTDANSVGFGMTDKNWCWNGNIWTSGNQGQGWATNTATKDKGQGIYFRDGTDDVPVGWIKDSSYVNITIDICGSTHVIDDIPTNLSDTNTNKFKYSSSDAVIDNSPDSSDISFPAENDEETTNLGYRTFGTFYIIYYPQIGNM